MDGTEDDNGLDPFVLREKNSGKQKEKHSKTLYFLNVSNSLTIFFGKHSNTLK